MTAQRIIKELEKTTTFGRRRYDVFEDWISIMEQVLRMLPAHLSSMRTEGRPAEDDEAAREVYERVRAAYWDSAAAIEHLHRATWLAMDAVEYEDIIGQVYMLFGDRSGHMGQYFTPSSVCQVLARIAVGTVDQITRTVHERILAALRHAERPDYLLASIMLSPDGSHDWQAWAHRMPDEHFTPVTVYDPACGSGGMFLAAAEQVPEWMNRMGLVHYYGQDLDGMCVRMARLNLQIHGLNGHAYWSPSRDERPEDVEPDVTIGEGGQTRIVM